MAKVVTFGEIMLRLSPPGFERFLQSPAFRRDLRRGRSERRDEPGAVRPRQLLRHAAAEARYRRGGGARASLPRASEPTSFFAVAIGSACISSRPERASARRPSSTTARSSAISQLEPGTVDWAKVFDGADWFHVTGITPALGDKAAACTREAIEAAKKAGAQVSVDLNFRKKLWTEAQAQKVMRPLMANVDLVIANEEDIQSVLGLEVPNTDVTSGHLNLEGYKQVAQRLSKEFGPSLVAITLRESVSASDNGWSAALWDQKSGQFVQSQRYDVRLVDRIGGGDSFAAGMIYGSMTGRDPEASLRFAVAASALKQTIPGDFNRVSVAEVDNLAKGDASGRVQR